MSKETRQLLKIRLTPRDKEILQSYFHVVDMVADLVGPHCEVVLHALEDLERSVVKIVNGHHTGREVNSPITDKGLQLLLQYQKTGEINPKSYITTNKNNEYFKSGTSVIFGENGRAIGLLCININISAPFVDVIKTFSLEAITNGANLMEYFGSNPKEVIFEVLEKAISQVDNDVNISKKMRNKSICHILFEAGIFELKDTVQIVSERLSITKHAMYKFIREFKAMPKKEHPAS